jgi:hypothetical protein
MVRTEIDIGKGLASVIIGHWADALTTALLGIIGLLAILQTRYMYFTLVVSLQILGRLIFRTVVLLRKDLIMKAEVSINYGRITYMANSFYSAMNHVKGKTLMVEKAVSITLIIWAISVIRIALLTKASGYSSPLLELSLLLKLANMLSAIPFPVSGLGPTREE